MRSYVCSWCRLISAPAVALPIALAVCMAGCGLRRDVDRYGPDPIVLRDAATDEAKSTSIPIDGGAEVPREAGSSMVDGGSTSEQAPGMSADAARGPVLDAGSEGSCPGGEVDMEAADAGVLAVMEEIERNFVSSIAGRSVKVRWAAGRGTNGLPVIFVYHGDQDDGSGADVDAIQRLLPLEAAAAGRAVFVYPVLNSSAWQHFTLDGRARETRFVRDVTEALHRELATDSLQVFLAGWGGGGIIVNAMACALGRREVQDTGASPFQLAGVAVHSGTLYPLTGTDGRPIDFKLDFDDMADAPVPRCEPPGTLVIWGGQDDSDGTSIVNGRTTNEAYRRQLDCGYDASPWVGASSCGVYAGCSRPHVWCEVSGLRHAVWDGAAAAMWKFFRGTMVERRCAGEQGSSADAAAR